MIEDIKKMTMYDKYGSGVVGLISSYVYEHDVRAMIMRDKELERELEMLNIQYRKYFTRHTEYPYDKTYQHYIYLVRVRQINGKEFTAVIKDIGKKYNQKSVLIIKNKKALEFYIAEDCEGEALYFDNIEKAISNHFCGESFKFDFVKEYKGS